MDAHELPLREERIAQALARLDLRQAEEEADRFLVDAASDPIGDDPATAPLARARWMAAQVSLTAGRLDQALVRAGTLAPIVDRFQTPLTCRYWLLVAEAQARLGRPSAAREALARIAGDLLDHCRRTPLLQLRRLRIHLWLGELDHIEGELAHCLYQLNGDSFNASLLCLDVGRAHEEAGNLDAAQSFWQQALALSGTPETGPVRAEVLIQLGRVAHLRGRLQQALDHYEEAGNCAAPQTPAPAEVKLREALVWVELGRADQARQHVQELFRTFSGFAQELVPLARTVADLLGYAAGPSGRDEVKAWQAARRGERQAALALYGRLVAEERSSERRTRLGLALALLEKAEGREKEAAARLAEVERLARTHSLPEVLWRCLEARGTWAAETEEDDTLALKWLEEAIVVSETQGRQLRYGTIAAVYHLKRANLLRLLLRAKCRRGDARAVFHYQELERGRLLLELYSVAGTGSGEGSPVRGQIAGMIGPASLELAAIDKQLSLCETLLGLDGVTPEQNGQLAAKRVEMGLRRDRLLEAHLTDRSRRGDTSLPVLPGLAELEAALPAGTVYVSACLLEDELFLLVVRRGEGAKVIQVDEPAPHVVAWTNGWREQLHRTLAEYREGQWSSSAQAALEEPLHALGRSNWGAAMFGLVREGERLLWVPDDALHGLPLAALRRGGRYLVEKVEIVHAFSGAFAVLSSSSGSSAAPVLAKKDGKRRGPRRNQRVVVAESEQELPFAAQEGERVSAALGRSLVLHGQQASKQTLELLLASARVLHFACHAYFDASHALNASLQLPSGESWRLLEWLGGPGAGLPLLTLSACRSAEVTPLVGREVFGLVTAALASGVRTVVAGLWPVADRETVPFMGHFYRELLSHSPATALARTQRAMLPSSHPLFWAVFALFGDPESLPGPRFFWSRWWRRWRAARHARRFPDVLPLLTS
jgi:CHAT domain-containing protein/tetratricopeptide (TPR) repeat protein